MNINQFLDKIHFKKVCAVIIMGAIYIALQGCASKSQMVIGPVTKTGQVITFEGPKDVEMSFKKGDIDAKYSGKSEGFWAGVFKFLLMKAPEITVIK